MATLSRTFGRKFSTIIDLQQTDVLIVSRTQMGNGNVCIGGFDISNSLNVRLLMSNGGNQPENSPFQMGQIWQITYKPKANIVYPHSEDVIVQSSCYRRTLNNTDIKCFITQNCRIISGSPSELFEGSVHSPLHAASYIDRTSIPNHSVCFWKPNSNLTYTNLFSKNKYRYTGPEHDVYFAYVGLKPATAVIPQGSIVRMSLARWWSPPNSDSEACYLQLSGWF